MAFDERLVERIRGTLGRRKGLAEKKMFGWILVEHAGLKTDGKLGKWVQVGAKYASSLPAQ